MHHSTPPLHSLLPFLLDTFFSPASSLIVLAPPTLPVRSSFIGSLSDHCPFLLFLYLNMSRRRRRRRKRRRRRIRRPRTFKMPVNLNPTARRYVPDNYIYCHSLENRKRWMTLLPYIWTRFTKWVLQIPHWGHVLMHSHLNHSFSQLHALLQGNLSVCTELKWF
jgi:hypothetical protein